MWAFLKTLNSQRKRRSVDEEEINSSNRKRMRLDADNTVKEEVTAECTVSNRQNNEENVTGSEKQIYAKSIVEEHDNNVQISGNNGSDIPISEEGIHEGEIIMHEGLTVEGNEVHHELPSGLDGTIYYSTRVEDDKYYQSKLKRGDEVVEHEDDRNNPILVDEEDLQGQEVIKILNLEGRKEHVQIAERDISDGEAVCVDENGVILSNVPPEELYEYENALKRKMVKKMGRKVPVTLVDKLHAQCGICQAIVSLNKKFEIVHLVRHFNAYHPSVHRCSGSWPGLKDNTQATQQAGVPKPLSCNDFTIVDSDSSTKDNFQCGWCGKFICIESLAKHMDENHSHVIDIPRCHLCLLELVVNSRLSEKFGYDFQITLPDEKQFYCGKYDIGYSTEKDLEKGILAKLIAKLKKLEAGIGEGFPKNECEKEKDTPTSASNSTTNKIALVLESFSNSRMSLCRRSKSKGHSVQLAKRQAIPSDSECIEAISLCLWKCKLCGYSIKTAVKSAAIIRHIKSKHSEVFDQVRAQLCKVKLKKASRDCMTFINSERVKCNDCNVIYKLHEPYNLSKIYNHLKRVHPHRTPENGTDSDSN